MARVDLNSYFKTARDLHQSGKLKEARKLYQEILKLSPKHLDSIYWTAQSFYQEGQLEKSIEHFKKGAELRKGDINFTLGMSLALIKLRRLEEAHDHLSILIEHHPKDPKVVFHHARVLKEMGKLDEAEKAYKRLIELKPDHLQAINNLGNLYQLMSKPEEAMDCYDKLILSDPNFAMAYCNKASLIQRTDPVQAEQLYQKTLQVDSSNALAHYNLGIIANLTLDFAKAETYLKNAISLQPENLKFGSSYANNLYSIGKRKEAYQLLSEWINSQTPQEDPYIKMSRLLLSEERYKEAINVLRLLIDRNPYALEGHFMLGTILDFQRIYEEAEEHLIKSITHPDFRLRAAMTLQLLYSKMARLDKYDEMLGLVSNLLRGYVQGATISEEIPVYNLAYYPFDRQLKREVSAKYSKTVSYNASSLRKKLDFTYSTGEKIKIGYVSPYFYMHPSSQMVHDILKLHDRNKFSVVAYGLNVTKDKMTRKIEAVVDEFVDLSHMKVEDAAKRINNDGVNILVSLAGYNYGMKNALPALRPAPVQVVCMDYHESMQADFYDYMIKDEVVLPMELRKDYSESIAYLPVSHFLHSELVPSVGEILREQYGLNEDQFVFGCLNHPRKLNPTIASTWMDILKSVPNAVLWLYGMDEEVIEKNIRKFAKENGVDDNRIVFCGKEGYQDNYRRMKLMDLFLDTTIYNGHTTALEALWQGVPILTTNGDTVSSRMCASFLTALDLHELICIDLDQYVKKAISLGTNKKEMDDLRLRMKDSREKGDLFDIPNLVTSLEKSYALMWEKYQKGEVPADFKIQKT